MLISSIGVSHGVQHNSQSADTASIEQKMEQLKKQLKNIKNNGNISPEEKEKRIKNIEDQIKRLEEQKQSIEKNESDDRRFDSFEYQKQGETAGLYSVKKDESGNIKIVFDGDGVESISESKLIEKPNSELVVHKEDYDSMNGEDIVDSKNEEEDTEKPIIMVTTFDLSAVEREIKELKQKQQQLQQELNSAPEEEKKQIQAELETVTKELERKDTEAYRNSHDNRRQYILE